MTPPTSAPEAPAAPAASAPPVAPPAAAAPAPSAPAPVTAAAPAAGLPSVAPTVAPVAHDYSKLTAPDGSGFDAAYVASVAEWAKSENMTPAEAQATLKRESANIARFRSQSAAWDAELRNDPAFGGAKYDVTIKNRDAALQRFPSGKELGEELRATNWIAYPRFARFLAEVGAAFAEKPAVAGTQSPAKSLSYAEAFPATWAALTPAQRKEVGFE